MARGAGHTTHGAKSGGGAALPTFLNRLEQLLALQIGLLMKQQVNIHTLLQKPGLICFTHTTQGNK